MKSEHEPEPCPGEVWIRGDDYICDIVCVGIHGETREYFVVYRGAGVHTDVYAWIRPLHWFKRRFSKIEQLETKPAKKKFR